MLGRLIVVEGLDGTGKTALTRGLAEVLNGVVLTSPSPKFRPFRDQLEACFAKSPEARQLFYAATVLEASSQALEYINSGKDVIMDRYILSTLTYANLYSTPFSLEEIVPSLAVPTFTIYLRASRSQRKLRMNSRDNIGVEDKLTLTPVNDRVLNEEYLALLTTHPLTGRVIIIDTNGLTNEDAVNQSVKALELTG